MGAVVMLWSAQGELEAGFLPTIRVCGTGGLRHMSLTLYKSASGLFPSATTYVSPGAISSAQPFPRPPSHQPPLGSSQGHSTVGQQLSSMGLFLSTFTGGPQKLTFELKLFMPQLRSIKVVTGCP